MEKVNIKINNESFSVQKDLTILQAARRVGIRIPTLCYLKEINEIGACRMCVVEVRGSRNLVASCVTQVSEGMEIFTNTKRVRDSRKTTLELLLSIHDRKCLSCLRNGNCELQALCAEFSIEDDVKYDGEKPGYALDQSTSHLIRDNNKCILCRRCVAACANQHVAVIGANNRGFDTQIGCAFERELNFVPCVSCGQCIVNCPTGALKEHDQCDDVLDALDDKSKHVIVHTAPSIRVTLGEEFGLPIGTNVKGKMVTALRRLGFAKVFDTNFGADLTIMEEANEFVERLKNKGELPMITSCSPGWVKFCEYYYPEFIKNLSTCKSPQQMTSAMIKTFYAKVNNIDPKDIVVVSIMPCTAKKFEITREDQDAAGVRDTDIVLTTRELARLIKRAGINFNELPNGNFDEEMGISTGAGAIFGTTGGVMEAALRTAANMLSGESQANVDYEEIRGQDGFKEAVYNINGREIRVAVVSGLKNAAKLLDQIKNGEKDYHFIEVMCCPGGCINGGGQPIQPAEKKNFYDIKSIRAKALYDEDKNLSLRKSHESPIIKKVYSEFLEKPGSLIAHKVLHTSYVKRNRY